MNQMFLKCTERSESRFTNSYSLKFPVLELSKSLQIFSFNIIRSLGNFSSGSCPRDITDQWFARTLNWKEPGTYPFPFLQEKLQNTHKTHSSNLCFTRMQNKSLKTPLACTPLPMLPHQPGAFSSEVSTHLLPPSSVFSFHCLWGMAWVLVPAARRSPILSRHPPVCAGASFSLVPWHCWDTRTLSKLSSGSCSQGQTNLPLSRSTQAQGSSNQNKSLLFWKT